MPIGRLKDINQKNPKRPTIATHIGRGITNITQTLILGVRTESKPPNAKIAPEAPTAKTNFVPKSFAPHEKSPNKPARVTKNNPANIPPRMYSQKYLLLPMIFSTKEPMKNKETILKIKCVQDPCMNILVRRVHTLKCKMLLKLSAIFFSTKPPPEKRLLPKIALNITKTKKFRIIIQTVKLKSKILLRGRNT